MHNIYSLIVFVFVIAYTPGPNNIMSMENAIRGGFVKSLPFNFGVVFGMFVVCVASTFFVSTLLNSFPEVLFYIRCVGAAYMVYLAWHIFKSSDNIGTKELPVTGFGSGVLLQLVNPKVYIACIAGMSSYVLPYYSNRLAIFLFMVFIAVFGGGGSFAWSVFGSAFRTFFNRHLKTVNAVFSLLLVYCAASLFF